MKGELKVKGYLLQAKYYNGLYSFVKFYEEKHDTKINLEVHGYYYEDERTPINKHSFDPEKNEHTIVLAHYELRSGNRVGEDPSARDFYQGLRNFFNKKLP